MLRIVNGGNAVAIVPPICKGLYVQSRTYYSYESIEARGFRGDDSGL
jgi:hypothetical protein